MAKARQKVQELLESTALANKQELLESGIAEWTKDTKVDREAGIIRDVKLIGHKSKQGHFYTEKALREVVPLLEGARVFKDHAKPGEVRRSSDDVLGKIQRPYYKQGEGTFGDFKYKKTHPSMEPILEGAETMPELSGFSIHAYRAGPPTFENGIQVIDAIASVRSVDYVAEPATTTGLFESETVLKKQVTELLLPLLTDDQKKLMEDVRVDLGPLLLSEASWDGGNSYTVDCAFCDLLRAAFMDVSLDGKATLQKFKQILKFYTSLTGKKSGVVETVTESLPVENEMNDEALKKLEAEYKAKEALLLQESETLKAKNAEMQKQLDEIANKERVRKLCAEHKIENPSDVLVESLSLLDDAKGKALLEDYSKRTVGTTPAHGLGGNGGKLDKESFLKKIVKS